MRVCFPSTAAQYFHLLRRQMRDAKRIPLVVLTPKGILRHPRAMSRPQELAEGGFELVLDDSHVKDKEAVHRILLCAGKIYYDLLVERERRNSNEVAIVRIEQLYPYPEWNVSHVLESYRRAREICWVQEEPENMGACRFIRHRLARHISFGRELRCIGRPESSSPAAGSLRAHRKEQAALVNAAFE